MKVLYEVSFLLPGAADEQQKLFKVQEQARRNLEQDIDYFNLEANKQRKIIASLEKERDRWGYIFLIIYNLFISIWELGCEDGVEGPLGQCVW